MECFWELTRYSRESLSFEEEIEICINQKWNLLPVSSWGVARSQPWTSWRVHGGSGLKPSQWVLAVAKVLFFHRHLESRRLFKELILAWIMKMSEVAMMVEKSDFAWQIPDIGEIWRRRHPYNTSGWYFFS